MRGRLAGAIAATLLLSAGAACPQPTAVSKPSANTVEGLVVPAPAKPNPLVDPATRFVATRIPRSRFEQYARFHDPICVRVQGVPTEFAQFVKDRVLAVAREVKAPVSADLGCQANVNVIFSPAPQAQLADIGRRRDVLFGFHFVAETKRLSTFKGPVQSWYLTRTVDTDGRASLELLDPAPFNPDTGKTPLAKGKAGSRLGIDMSTELVHSLILVDANKVAGREIGAVADYVAVLALSRWRNLDACSPVDSILNLMAYDCVGSPPQAITESDIALLTGLYGLDPRESGFLQRAQMASAMRKAGAP